MNSHRFLPMICAAVLVLIARTPGSIAAQTTVAGADPLYKLDQNTRRQIEMLRDSANALGLPGHQLELKALEGYAKKVDPKKIVTAVRQLSTEMKLAHAALGTVNEGELVAAASALNDKVTPDELTQFKSFSRGRSPVTTFTALAGLIEEGVSRDDAVSTVLRLWKNGSNDDDFQGLLLSIDRDVHSGVTPGASLLLRARELPPRPPRPPEQPENH